VINCRCDIICKGTNRYSILWCTRLLCLSDWLVDWLTETGWDGYGVLEYYTVLLPGKIGGRCILYRIGSQIV